MGRLRREKHIIKIRKDNGFPAAATATAAGLGSREILHFRDISGCQFRMVSRNVIWESRP